jgi:type VI secretion system protein ImpC
VTRPDDSDDPLDRLLGMVDTQIDAKTAPPAPTPQEDTAAKRAVSAFIGSMGGRKPQKPSAGAGDALRALDALIAAQLAEILDDPAFEALEGAWRTLRFLLRRCDRRAQCFLHAIEAPKDTAHDSLRTVLIDQSDQQPAGLGLLLSTYVYNSGAPDVALLQQLAGIGEEIQVPVVAAIAPDFIRGVTDADLAKAREPETLFQDEAYTPWTSLRAKPVARWLGVAANRIQLRAAHDLSEDRKLPLSGVTTVGEPLEAGGGVIVAALAAESAALTGWPSDLLGPDRVVDSLPLYAGEGNVLAVASPLRADAAGSLANVGLIAVVGQANRDTARLVRAPSVRSGRADTTGDLPRAGTFDYQLAVSRLIRNVEANADLIFAESTSAAIRDAMQGFLDGLMGPGASVQVTIETDDADEQVLAIDIRTGRDILGGVTMRLDLRI